MEIRKILIIDDNKNEQLFLTRALSKLYSCEVLVADNGQQGLEKIVLDEPDVVFLDVMMPVMDGIQMLEILRLQHPQITTPIIALTARSDGATLNKLLTLGVEEYLLKPINFEQIANKIDKIAGRKGY